MSKKFWEDREIKSKLVQLGKELAAEQGASLVTHEVLENDREVIYLMQKDGEMYTWPVPFCDIKVLIKPNK